MGYLDAIQNITIADIKLDLMRTAYDNDEALLNKFDPRIVIIWSAIFVIVPWFFYEPEPLFAMLIAALLLAYLSQTSIYLLVLLIWGSLSNIGFIVILSSVVYWWQGGPGGLRGAVVDNSVALLPFTMKLTVISVVSLAAFSAMSPKKLAKGLLSLGVPRPFTFAIAYGYRMVPVLVEEYHDLVNSLRLRNKAPEKSGLLRWRYYLYLLKLSIKAFYPMAFNVAKRSRVTVEAMETQGFSHSLGNEASRELRLGDLQILPRDVTFMLVSLLFVVVVSVFL
ncbi:energy-coupling factor transporter transmembrane protein EcfT [Natronomonas sp. F2-12]|uniref:Energy-coupling factor transporter transmembrane protein EcfT n=1 Tax=Natronomonas aquatica TaxID=2841590 RepID=A0A9R1CUX6_9EURY|nr:energy-coupling factor transporter transmembrane component T [Natronomonas aquatica]MCQ4334248.1 energy-coupling factor transporter transmembrane protein EcfT [Natronomonas aquatica]